MTDARFLPIIPIAQASHAKFFPRGPFVSIDLAQWGVESGYGAHMSGVNNPWGIKATQAQRAAGEARLVLDPTSISADATSPKSNGSQATPFFSSPAESSSTLMRCFSRALITSALALMLAHPPPMPKHCTIAAMPPPPTTPRR